MNGKQYIQYGCGWCAPVGWRNFDASPTLRFERIPLLGRLYTKNQARFPENVEYGDIVAGLPVPDNSCQVVYCSHILEHLALDDFRLALKNTYKILAYDGVFRFVMPDLEFIINNYIGDPTHHAAINLMRSTLLGKEKRSRGLQGLIYLWLNNSQHLWMWDYKSMQFELQQAGFTNIRRAGFGDSSHAIFQEVESLERWENCLGVECKKIKLYE
jgi:ubiquinone/menaquinone biosynthesis C-methylase UbiE